MISIANIKEKSFEKVSDVLLSVIVNGDVANNCFILLRFSTDVQLLPALAIIVLKLIALLVHVILILVELINFWFFELKYQVSQYLNFKNNLNSSSKSNSFLTYIKYSVVFTNKWISNNKKWSSWWWNINTSETKNTNTMSQHSNFKNIIISS